jgi:hypothetical protein
MTQVVNFTLFSTTSLVSLHQLTPLVHLDFEYLHKFHKTFEMRYTG